jgi:hypothetical protein
MTPLIFNKFPGCIPKNGDLIFFLHHRSYGISHGIAKTEYTWDNEEGDQVVYTGKETEEQINDLGQDGYKLIQFFIPEEGYSTPYGHFLWCLTETMADIYANEFPSEFEEDENGNDGR